MKAAPTKGALAATLDWGRAVVAGWDRFWFTPQQPHTLAAVRILGGAMLLYTHLVWTLDLEAFLGPQAWLTRDTVALMNQTEGGRIYAWSYLAWTDSPALLWPLHIAALIVLAMLMVGLFTRVTSVLALIVALSYCHRLTGTLFGLDQINAFIAMYLVVGPAGAVWSVDRWLAARQANLDPPAPAVTANIAIRLLQLHMCVIYLFGGISKMRGDEWWDGTALWYGIANLEYHHFKYAAHRQPGDVHLHFFGTATLSFADGVRVAPGDRFEIDLPALGAPLINPLALAERSFAYGDVKTL